jgi:hypothetical protein
MIKNEIFLLLCKKSCLHSNPDSVDRGVDLADSEEES